MQVRGYVHAYINNAMCVFMCAYLCMCVMNIIISHVKGLGSFS